MLYTIMIFITEVWSGLCKTDHLSALKRSNEFWSTLVILHKYCVYTLSILYIYIYIYIHVYIYIYIYIYTCIYSENLDH